MLVASSRAIYGEGAYNCLKHGIVYPEFRTEEDLEAKDFGMKCPICGESVSVVATKEDALLHPVSVYGITKQVQEELNAFHLLIYQLTWQFHLYSYQYNDILHT